MSTDARLGPGRSQESHPGLSPTWLAGTYVLGLSFAISKVRKQGAGLEAGEPGLKPALQYKAEGRSSSGVTCCGTVPASGRLLF